MVSQAGKGVSRSLKDGKKIRIAVDFSSMEDAVDFFNQLRDRGVLPEDVGLREADVLELRRSEAYTLLLRSLADVSGHTGQVLPVAERLEGETVDQLRERLGPLQRQALDALISDVV